jgi:hypothetical protein
MPSNNSTDGLGPWVPGLYRLDLLTSPTDAIRSVVLVIDPPSGAAPSAVAPSSAPVAIDTITPIAGSLVLFEPNGASVEQQAASSAEGDTSCSLAKLWRGETAAPGTTCAAIPAAGLAAIGVGLQIRAGSPSKEPASISLQQLDPVRRDVPVVTRALLQGAVVVRADGHPLDDGFYELKATTFAGETLHWYLDVIGPPS